MHSCSKEKHQKPEKKKSGKSRAWLFELFILIFSLLHSKHQPEEENVCFESNLVLFGAGAEGCCYKESGGLPETQTPLEWKGLCDLLHALWFDSGLWSPLAPLLILQCYQPKGNYVTADIRLELKVSQYGWNLD